MDNEIESVLWDFLRENCLPQKGDIDLQNTDNLFNSGVIDSAGLIHFVCFIEKKFDIIIMHWVFLVDCTYLLVFFILFWD